MAATKETTAVDVGALLDACDGAVVTLVAGETRLVAHRAVLVDRSPVFSAMFAHDTLEACSGEVTIEDVEGPVLRQLVSYLYTLRAPQVPGTAIKLLEAANKYRVAGLKAACEQQVAVEAAAAVVRDSCTDLSKAAFNLIKANVQVMAAAVLNQPKDVAEVSRLLADPPAETSAPPPADSGTSHQPSTRPHSGGSRHSGTPASAALATAAPLHIPPPDDAYVSQLRGLSKGLKHDRLIEAARDGAVVEVEGLLAAGAGVAARGGSRTALHWAAEEGNVEVARRLLAWGAPVEAIDSSQMMTPLHLAAARGHVALVQLLLAASADHRARNCNGWTPLHYAAHSGRTLAVAALLEAGADRGATNHSRQTPLDLVMDRNRHHQLVEMLTRM